MPLFNPQYWGKQPTVITKIADGSISDSIFFSYNAAVASQQLDLVSGKALRFLAGAAPLRAYSRQGQALKTVVRQDRIQKLRPTELSVMWVGDFTQASENFAVMGGMYYDAGFTSPFYSCLLVRRVTGASDIISLGFNNGGFQTLNSTLTNYVTGSYVIIGTVKNGRQALYIKRIGGATGGGLEVVTSSVAGAIAYGVGGGDVIIGDNSGSSRNPYASTAMLTMFSQELRRQEVVSLLNNPWQIYAHQERLPFTYVPPTPTTGTASFTFNALGSTSTALTNLNLSDRSSTNLFLYDGKR